jgi:hypothetical protein
VFRREPVPQHVMKLARAYPGHQFPDAQHV